MSGASHKASNAEQAASAAVFLKLHRVYICGSDCLTAWDILRNAGEHLEAAVRAELQDDLQDDTELHYIAAWATASSD